MPTRSYLTHSSATLPNKKELYIITSSNIINSNPSY
eukprot:gene7981-5541_t